MRIKSDLRAALALAAAPLLYFLPAVLGQMVLCPEDGMLFNVPLRVAAAGITLSGSLPLWNPYIFAGMPLLGAAQGGLLFPLNWLYLVFTPAVATNLSVLASYALAGVGAYLYARRSGSTVAGSFVTGLAWQWCGFLVAQLAHVNVVQTAATLPWVLWALEGYGREGGGRRGALVSVFVALQAFAGHPQTLAYSLLLVVAYALTMALADRQARARYLRSLAFVAAGLLLAAVQLLPTFELLGRSVRAGATYEFFNSFSLPRRFALTFFAPYVLGGGDGRWFAERYTGPPFYAEFIAYAGVLALMLSLSALLLSRDARTMFWAAAGVACFLLALGGHAPLGLSKLVYQVPFLNLFRVPSRHLMEVDFALAVLAGRGLTALADRRGTSRALRRAAFAAGLVLALTFLAVTVLRPDDAGAGGDGVSVLQTPELFVPLFVAALSAAALCVFARWRRRGASALFLLVLAVDLLVWGQSSGWRTSSPGSDSDFWGEPETVRALRPLAPADPSSYRILTAPHTFDPSVPPVPPSISRSGDWVPWTQPDVYMMHGIQNAAGYDGFGLARYSRLAGDMKLWGELTDPDATLRGEGREIDILNVRYLLSIRKRDANAPSDAGALPAATERLGRFAFAANDLGLPKLGAGRRLVFHLPNIEADGVALLTSLSWSEDVPEGALVARVRLRSREGDEFEFALRAGTDTAEWAFDRPDIRARVRHRRPAPARSEPVEDAERRYEGHAYAASLALPRRVALSGGEIEVLADERWPELQLGVFRVSLLDEGSGAALAVTRERFRVEPANARRTNAGRWRLAAQTNYVDIYENTQVLPRAWLAAEARALGGDEALAVIRAGRLPGGARWEPLRTALVETEPPAPLGTGGGGSAEVALYEANRVEVKCDAKAPSILVLADNHYPGWTAYVDGRAAEVLRVNYGQRGVYVPEGVHLIRFVYRPNSLLVGLAVSFLTGAALCLVSLSPLSKRNKV